MSAALPGPDLLDVDALLTETERELRDVVRDFATERVGPHIAEWFEEGVVPREIVPELGKLGLLGMHLHGYGCAGTNAVSYGLACLELEAVDSGLRSLVSVQGSLAMYAIYAYGSEEQKQQWLPEMAAGRAIGCFGLTEPDFGSNPAGMRTTARRDGSGDGADWVLNGSKMWITNGGIADIAVVWARAAGSGKGARAAGSGESARAEEGIRGFLVPRGTPGFTTSDIHHKLSLRASVTSELVLDDVRLPADAMLPGIRGLAGPLGCLAEARFGIIWGSLGAARSSWLSARDYACSRVQFDKPIAAYQLTQAKLVDTALEWSKGQLLALHLGRRKDDGTVTPEQISAGKLNNVREALAICREARTILGANGITLEYPVIRHMNNLESVLTYEGTSEIHTLVLGQHLTGHAAFK